MAIQTLTYTEVIGRCHGLPYPDEQQYAQITAQFYHFRLKEVWNADDSGNYVTVGWIVPCTAINMPWTSKFRVDHQSKTIDIPYAEGEDYESRAITEQLIVARSQGLLSLSKKLEEELYRVLGINRTVRVPRGGSALFGIQTFGIQMTGYVLSEKTGEMKIWVPKRSATRMQWPAEEEASLPREFMRENAKVVGTISYFHVRDAKAPGGLGFVDRSLQFIYDVELPSHIVPKPLDDEVEEFYLWTIDQTVEAIKQGKFKSNAAATLIDFLFRHGFISPKLEPELETVIFSLIRRRPL